METKFWPEINVEDLGVDGRTIYKYIVRKYSGKLPTDSSSSRYRTVRGLL
jgi:hypothetical protein